MSSCARSKYLCACINGFIFILPAAVGHSLCVCVYLHVYFRANVLPSPHTGYAYAHTQLMNRCVARYTLPSSYRTNIPFKVLFLEGETEIVLSPRDAYYQLFGRPHPWHWVLPFTSSEGKHFPSVYAVQNSLYKSMVSFVPLCTLRMNELQGLLCVWRKKVDK